MSRDPDSVRRSVRRDYDAVSEDYAQRFRDELDHKPFDRELLDRIAERLRDAGPVADVGCGPGQIARHLYERGVDVRGIDLSPGMIARARELHPAIEFSVGDMGSLELADGELAGITSFYSIIHAARDDVVRVLSEFRRVLRDDGLLLLCFHLGSDVTHLTEWWGKPVDIDFVFFERDEMEAKLREAGFEIDEILERDPYPDVEADTRRAYFIARTPALRG
jgi:SAM-dependent methyltransferase